MSSKPDPRGKIKRALTDDKGWIKAISVLVSLLVLVWGALGWIPSLWDRGPKSDDIKVTLDILPDASAFGGVTHFLLPYGSVLPAPLFPTYCGDTQRELARRGTTIGTSMTITLQNTYQGSKPAAILVKDVRAVAVSSRPAGAGVIVECFNSGGDTPIVATLRASDGALAQTNLPPSLDSNQWRFSDPQPAGTVASFVLDAGEPQEINLTISPGLTDQKVQIVADVVANGERLVVPVTKEPVWVLSDSASSPIVIRVKSLLDGPPHYNCVPAKMYSASSICTTDRVPTQLEEQAALSQAR